MFSRSLEMSLNHAFTQAREKRHEFITVEHLLLGLLENPEACLALTACGANIDRLRAGLGIFIDETTPHIPMNIERDIQPTLSFQRVLQRAIYQVQTTGNLEVNGMNVLTAIFGEQDSQAVYFLNQENVTRIDVVNYATQGIAKQPREQTEYFSEEDMQSETIIPRETSSEDSLVEMYTVNLNEKATNGGIDPVIGRDDELQRCIQILCRRGKNNPLLVGEAGVGKTAIAEGLAQLIVNKKVPKPLANTTVYSLDLGVLLAGTKYRGDFEKRFKSVLKALGRHTGAIIFIDEIHNLVGAGSATGGTMDAANLIKPILSSGDLRCMGATTYDEFRNFISKDHALLRRFQKIDVSEPTPEEAVDILIGLKSYFEDFHKLKYTKDALKRAVDLSSRYMSDRHLPDKAIDVIDEAGAFEMLQPESKRKNTIDVKEIEAIIAKMARVPLQNLSNTDKQLLKQLPRKLKKAVFGQDLAVETLTNAIKLSRSGLRDKNKPIGSFLMAGPTGVGKTELTRQLAQELGVDLLRFDMSEYMEKHAVSRLIGAPPGYVGFDQGGMLTEEVIKKPHAVVLLDEIEKAHPDMFNILLQIMDYGQLTDNNGRKADFKHVILIMTSNVGADALEKQAIGFNNQSETDDNMMAMKQMFSPEFRNRLDAVVQFKNLAPNVMMKIVDKDLQSLHEQLAEKNVQLNMSDTARKWLAANGYDRNMGARPLQRLIQEKIRKPLADELLFGKLHKGHMLVNVDFDEDQLQIEYEDLREIV
ncbi:MAG: ATP-dependent Clp protease ATP-binding subunit ClpA [Gammaproteobacteria bacterium]|nr:ATP-dependent Clp protease ATP-binding subunit ClpA [Gammaproteobacteria bacterium]MCH9743786.1 ATP-dependent Clp protease ATP-binding subunit ClpA [Gammaproteobacteria bacterium]